MEHVSHEFEPVWNKRFPCAGIGHLSFGEVQAAKFITGIRRTVFWKVTAALLERGVPERIEEKRKAASGRPYCCLGCD